LLNVGLSCQPLDGAAVDADVVIAYCTVCPLPVRDSNSFTVMLADDGGTLVFTVGRPLTAAPATLFTVKVTLKLSENPPLPVPPTVTVARCCPPRNPCMGLIVNVVLPPVPMLSSLAFSGGSDVGGSDVGGPDVGGSSAGGSASGDTIMKLCASGPDNMISNSPVG